MCVCVYIHILYVHAYNTYIHIYIYTHTYRHTMLLFGGDGAAAHDDHNGTSLGPQSGTTVAEGCKTGRDGDDILSSSSSRSQAKVCKLVPKRRPEGFEGFRLVPNSIPF